MSADKPASIIVTLDDDACADIGGKKKELEAAGLKVERVLDFIGQITGQWSEGDVETLRRIKGVVDIEVSSDVQLSPPGSPIQ